MKHSYWICGGGSHINCDDWDNVNGCWQNQINVFGCSKFAHLDQGEEEDMRG